MLFRSGNLAMTTMVGASSYDLSGTGTAPVIGIEIDVRLTSFLVVEPGLRFFRHNTRANRHDSYLFPEITIQLQVPTNLLSPYLGAGAGMSAILEGRNRTDLTLHVAVGVHVQLASKWSVRPEARLRSVNPWGGNTFDLTLGISRSL